MALRPCIWLQTRLTPRRKSRSCSLPERTRTRRAGRAIGPWTLQRGRWLRDYWPRPEERGNREAPAGGLGALIAGVAVGTALGAAGAGDEEALAAGTIFAEQVRTGQPSPGGVGTADAAGGGMSVGGSCQIPGYPRPPGGVANLGLSWCPASVSMQARAFALQAAGAQCALATGSSSTPAQINARRQEINAACGRLAALGAPNCQCPPGLRP